MFVGVQLYGVPICLTDCFSVIKSVGNVVFVSKVSRKERTDELPSRDFRNEW